MSTRAAWLVLAAALASAGCQGRAQEASARDGSTGTVTTASPAPATPSAEPVPAAPGLPLVVPAGAAEAPLPPPAGAGTPADALWRVKDNKVRCVRAPCPTLDAIPVSSSDATTQVVEVDLSGLGLSPKDEQQLLSRVYGEGLRVRGRVEERADPRGRPCKVLKATGLGPQ